MTRDLHKAFGAVPVLTGVDLEVTAGSFTAVLGPSGSGKTTLLRVVAGFERADAGTVVLGGAVVEGPGRYVAPDQRGIGYVPQEAALFPHLTVEANVGFGLRGGRYRSEATAHGTRRHHRHDADRDRSPRRHASRRRRVGALLETVGLSGLGKRYPHQLSGGQQQRVALARALAINPRIVLLDEPFGSLDPTLRAAVRADVRRLLAGAGTTAILVTHDQDEALSLADQLAVLRHGRIVQSGTPREIYLRPIDAEMATFLGTANLLDGVIEPGATTVETVLGALPLDEGATTTGKVRVLVRPEELVVGLPPGEGGEGVGASARRGPTALVAGYDFHGHDVTVHLAVAAAPTHPELSLVARVAGSPRFEPGSEVTLSATGPVTVWPVDSAASDSDTDTGAHTGTAADTGAHTGTAADTGAHTGTAADTAGSA